MRDQQRGKGRRRHKLVRDRGLRRRLVLGARGGCDGSGHGLSRGLGLDLGAHGRIHGRCTRAAGVVSGGDVAECVLVADERAAVASGGDAACQPAPE